MTSFVIHTPKGLFGGDQARRGQRRFDQLAVRDDPHHEADVGRFGGVDQAARQHELEDTARPHEPWEQPN